MPLANVTVRNDAHTHIWAPSPVHPERVPVGTIGSPEALLSDMDRANVARAAVISPRSMGWDDAFTIEAARRHPDRFVAIVRYDVSNPNALSDLRKKYEEGVRGVRIAVDDGPLARFLEPEAAGFWRFLADKALVLAVHADYSELGSVAMILERNPEVTVLLDHMGRPDVSAGIGNAAFTAVLGLAAHPSLLLKTPDAPFFSAAGAPFADLRPFVESALSVFGPERVLWSSDWPLCTVTETYEASVEPTLEATQILDAAERDLVFRGNFERVFPHA